MVSQHRAPSRLVAIVSLLALVELLLISGVADAAPVQCTTADMTVALTGEDKELAICDKPTTKLTVTGGGDDKTLTITNSKLDLLTLADSISRITVIIRSSTVAAILAKGTQSVTLLVEDTTLSGYDGNLYISGLTMEERHVDSTFTFTRVTVNWKDKNSESNAVFIFRKAVFERSHLRIDDSTVDVEGSKPIRGVLTQSTGLELIGGSTFSIVKSRFQIKTTNQCSFLRLTPIAMKSQSRFDVNNSVAILDCTGAAGAVDVESTTAMNLPDDSVLNVDASHLEMKSEDRCGMVNIRIGGRGFDLVSNQVTFISDCDDVYAMEMDGRTGNDADAKFRASTSGSHYVFRGSKPRKRATIFGNTYQVEADFRTTTVTAELDNGNGPTESMLVYWYNAAAPSGRIEIWDCRLWGFTVGSEVEDDAWDAITNLVEGGFQNIFKMPTCGFGCVYLDGSSLDPQRMKPQAALEANNPTLTQAIEFAFSSTTTPEQMRVVCPLYTNTSSATITPPPTPTSTFSASRSPTSLTPTPSMTTTRSPTVSTTPPETVTPTRSTTLSVSQSNSLTCDLYTATVSPSNQRMSQFKQLLLLNEPLRLTVSVNAPMRINASLGASELGSAVQITWGRLLDWRVITPYTMTISIGAPLGQIADTLDIYTKVTIVILIDRIVMKCAVDDIDLEVPLEPVKSYISQFAQDSAEAGAVATGMISSALSNPSSAMMSARAASVMTLSMCEGTATDQVGLTSSPLQMKLGSPHSAYFRGAVIGNFVVVLYLVILCSLLVLAYYDPRKVNSDRGSLWGSMGIFHLPGVLCVPIVVLSQGTAEAATLLLYYSKTSGDTFLGVLAILCQITIIATFAYQTTVGHRCVVTRREAARPDSTTNPLIRFWILIYLSNSKWVDDPKRDDSKGFKLHWQQLFNDYRSRRQWYLGFEMFISGVVGVLTGVRDPRYCTGVGIAFFLLLGVQCACALILRPFVAPFETVFHMSISSLIFISAGILALGELLGSEGALELGAHMGLAITILASLKMLIDVGGVLRWFFSRYKKHQEMKLARLLREQAIAKQRETMLAQGFDLDGVDLSGELEDEEDYEGKPSAFVSDVMNALDRLQEILCCTKSLETQATEQLRGEEDPPPPPEEPTLVVQDAPPVDDENAAMLRGFHVEDEEEFIEMESAELEEEEEPREEEAEEPPPGELDLESSRDSFASLDEFLGPSTRRVNPPLVPTEKVLASAPSQVGWRVGEGYEAHKNLSLLVDRICRKKFAENAQRDLHHKRERNMMMQSRSNGSL